MKKESSQEWKIVSPAILSCLEQLETYLDDPELSEKDKEEFVREVWRKMDTIRRRETNGVSTYSKISSPDRKKMFLNPEKYGYKRKNHTVISVPPQIHGYWEQLEAAYFDKEIDEQEREDRVKFIWQRIDASLRLVSNGKRYCERLNFFGKTYLNPRTHGFQLPQEIKQ